MNAEESWTCYHEGSATRAARLRFLPKCLHSIRARHAPHIDRLTWSDCGGNSDSGTGDAGAVLLVLVNWLLTAVLVHVDVVSGGCSSVGLLNVGSEVVCSEKCCGLFLQDILLLEYAVGIFGYYYVGAGVVIYSWSLQLLIWL